MIQIARSGVLSGTATVLNRRQDNVNVSPDPRAEAKRSWATFGGAARNDVLSQLSRMASGLQRCMYCEDSMGTDIDHFRPKNDFPEYAFQWTNYFLACSHCNSNAKRTEFPVLHDGQRALIDPVEDDPLNHLVLSPRTGRYVGLDERGRESIRVFALNRQVCVDGRRNAWLAVESLILRYSTLADRRNEVLTALAHYPFQGVRGHMRRVLASPMNKVLLPSPVVEALTNYPELV